MIPHGLERHGLEPRGQVRRNLAPALLYEESLARKVGTLVHMGALATLTGPHTGRSPKDRYIVRDDSTEKTVDWGPVNVALSPTHFDALRRDVIGYLNSRDLFVQDARAGADPTHGIAVRVISESPWHALFAQNMFLRLEDDGFGKDALAGFVPDFTVLHAPGLTAVPARHGTRSEVAIVVNFTAREVLIAGTHYAGEIKKSIFSVLNQVLPDRDVFPMHCSANVGASGDVALFFGLSGTGKTTLSADPTRGLIGDDEHGWGAEGVFNFEGGCYAKAIRLSHETEPDIYRATQMFGTILENVVLDERARTVDFEDASITENTRASYPIHYIANAVPSGRGGHPKHVVFLTADAFGVLPPVARLTPAQAMYHFLSGYTARVAGTERGVTEPAATFSACFGAPFLPRPAGVYAEMLGKRLREHRAQVWMVNTGWTGGAYGTGTRLKLAHTRAMVHAALDGRLSAGKFAADPVFGVDVPAEVPEVPREVLTPRATWKDGAAYDAAAAKVAKMFKDNFAKFEKQVSAEVKGAGPK
ncbi:MAG: phosphoenolpyruvate carboxykinase (ATP) [Longimicrobiales bacterium]